MLGALVGGAPGSLVLVISGEGSRVVGSGSKIEGGAEEEGPGSVGALSDVEFVWTGASRSTAAGVAGILGGATGGLVGGRGAGAFAASLNALSLLLLEGVARPLKLRLPGLDFLSF